MFSIQVLLGKNERFFDLLEAAAHEAQHSAQTLIKTLEHSSVAASLEELVAHRRAIRKVRDSVTEELCRTFITPIEREDIEALANALFKVAKAIEKFAEHYLAAKNPPRADYFLTQARLLARAMEHVSQMVRELRKKWNAQRVRELNDQIQKIESDADHHMLALLQELYSGQYEALQVLILRDLNELLEKAIDRCRDTGNTIFQVTLKYS